MSTVLNNGHKVVALIPAHNEARFIGSVVLQALVYAQTVIVVDDGSRDGTGEVAERAGAVVVRHGTNQGKGAALNTGFRTARRLDPDALVVLDGDGQHHPDELTQVLAPILQGEADIVVGSRYLGTTSQVPRHRRVGHRAFNALTNAASGVRVTDSQSGFRAFSRHALAHLSFSSQGFAVESEMQFLARAEHLDVAEVAITISYQDEPKRSVLMHGLNVLNGVLKLMSRYRPFLLFGGLGMVILIIGILWGVWLTSYYSQTGSLPLGHAIICAVLFSTGLIITSTAVTIHSVQALLVQPLDARHPG